jgi:hypothetical protein
MMEKKDMMEGNRKKNGKMEKKKRKNRRPK